MHHLADHLAGGSAVASAMRNVVIDCNDQHRDKTCSNRSHGTIPSAEVAFRCEEVHSHPVPASAERGRQAPAAGLIGTVHLITPPRCSLVFAAGVFKERLP